jgi:hypothetical protein
VSAARAVLGVALVGAAILGVLVSLRYLVFAYFVRDRELAVMAMCALGVYGFAALLLVIGGVL